MWTEDRAPTDEALLALEEQYHGLRAQLREVEERIRLMRAARERCSKCGGLGRRRLRGGLYGEWREELCGCVEHTTAARGVHI
jgi:hypothetical protein